MADAVVADGEHVVVELLAQPEFIKVVRVSGTKKERLGKVTFSLQGAIGRPFGAVYEVDRGRLIPKHASGEDTIDALVEEGNLEKGADNRHLRDDRGHQGMSSTQIYDLKQQGAKREHVIKQIVESSKTFKSKTEYSQAKYLARKKRQHLTDVRVLKPTLPTLWRVYSQKAPQKICFMRNDALAMLLLRANVRAGGRFLVMDTCNGLVAAAMAQRVAAVEEPKTLNLLQFLGH
ncbi:hypothetical protein PTSG_06482 [Salpingoeca rosetta]|uniref:tRNA (adenine(58)-N(1))-methyltransferase non-catalytic subunit TRM6 n=1 Tax=Salpingoeca rosetta (strain ATCC 50818 / BSB-021) TaxID=946362 RepID=F2UFX9_SALR5|nr:uncharacterized protein PTSG_06482 [Salpingoeca rosetta]EGD75407.1 hypothetical protein PTSG_06482 [Salpingoeca rosetta]|eukprot:XP_004991864.1 hypothetical protein PTSG_06482 [Salpingoeca rosetta]